MRYSHLARSPSVFSASARMKPTLTPMVTLVTVQITVIIKVQ